MQQLLPFTVLKPVWIVGNPCGKLVATALTVYGIETVFLLLHTPLLILVATALTVYGIETHITSSHFQRGTYRPLQQLLPFTVLKRIQKKIREM